MTGVGDAPTDAEEWMRKVNRDVSFLQRQPDYGPEVTALAAAGFYAVAAGTLNLPALTAGNSTTAAVLFPAGRFTIAPIVLTTAESSRLTTGANAITTFGFTYLLGNWSPANVGATSNGLHWVAMQRLVGAAEG